MGEVGPCESLILQNSMLIRPVLHKSCAGNSSCFEFMNATAMSFLEDRKFHDTHQSTDSDTLYPVCCPHFGEGNIPTPFRDEHFEYI